MYMEPRLYHLLAQHLMIHVRVSGVARIELVFDANWGKPPPNFQSV